MKDLSILFTTYFPCFRDWDLCIAFLDSKTGNKHVG